MIQIVLPKNSVRVKKDITLNIANVYHAVHLTREKLAEKGYLKVNTKVSASDAVNMQRIEFTPKAKPFLIGTVQQRNVFSYGSAAFSMC